MKFPAALCPIASLGILLCGFAAGQGSGPCDRDCLNGFVDQYLDALVRHDPKLVPLTKNVKFTENGQRLDPGDGLWRSMSAKATYQLTITNTHNAARTIPPTIADASRRYAT